MKVHSAVVKLVLRTNKTLTNGYHPIMLRVSFGYRKEKSTGYACDVAHWDKKNQCLKSDFANAAEINKIITEYKNKIVARKLKFEMDDKRYTPEMLLDDTRPEYSARSCVYKEIMDNLLSQKQLRKSTRAHYDYSYRLLADYMGNERFMINDLNEFKMQRFLKDKLKQLSEGTLHNVCSKIAAVSNHAMLMGVLSPEDYCFRRLKYSNLVRKANKTAYIDKDNLLRIEKYYLDLVTEGTGEHWQFNEEALSLLRKRTTKEFALCFWLAMLKLNGSAPIDVALLKKENFAIRHYADSQGVSHQYYCFDFKRAKTGAHVRPRIICDRLSMAIFQPFIETCHLRDGYIFPVIQDDDHSLKPKDTYESMKNAVQYVARITLEWMRLVCREINRRVTVRNTLTNQHRPLIDVENLSCYNIRHSFAMAYLSTPGSNVSSLASLMARSPNSISTYITQLNRDYDLIASVANIGI